MTTHNLIQVRGCLLSLRAWRGWLLRSYPSCALWPNTRRPRRRGRLCRHLHSIDDFTLLATVEKNGIEV